MSKSELPLIGISIGEAAGIGPEIIIQTLTDERMYQYARYAIFGNSKVLNFYKKLIKTQHFKHQKITKLEDAKSKICNVFNVGKEEIKLNPGHPTNETGSLAIDSLDAALEAFASSKIDALVTAPLDKGNIKTDDKKFTGHTSYIKQFCNEDDCLMLLCSDYLKVGLVTEHLPLEKVSERVTSDAILKKLEILNTSLQKDFMIQIPKIAILGLNPHAGDNGLLGAEERDVIIPAVSKAREKNILAIGPFSADGFFAAGKHREFDAILAMYHDQGLIPFKAMSFGEGVNFTAGLPIVRTSPDHGTAYDIAGKNEVSCNSFRTAIFQAIDIIQNRADYREMHINPLKIKKKKSERFSR